MKVALRYYYTDTAFKIIKKNVEDGTVKLLKEKWYDVSDTAPELYSFKTIGIFKKTMPCFTIHHKYNKSFEVLMEANKEQKDFRKQQYRFVKVYKPLEFHFDKPNLIDPENPSHKKMKGAVSPQNYKDMMTSGAMNALLDVKKLLNKDVLMYIMIGAAMGVMMGLLLYPAIYGFV